MKTIKITISFEARDLQSEELSTQEINETIAGLTNSLKTQVNNVSVVVE